MAPPGTLGVQATRTGEAMPPLIVPETLLPLLAAFAPCFTAPSYRTFCLLVSGWLHCRGRHTVTGLVIAAGAVGSRHISVFHRFFARAPWSLDALGQVVFSLALRWIPAGWPLFILIDDTLARKHGKGISLATMHHDPLLSSARKPFCSFGHVWVVLALWVPLPLGRTGGFALPLLFRLYVGAKRGGKANAAARRRSRPRPTSSPDQAGVGPRVDRAGGRVGRRADRVRRGRQRLRRPDAARGPPRERSDPQSPAPGRRPLGATGAPLPGAEGPPPPPRPALAHPESHGRDSAPLGAAADHHLRPPGDPAGLQRRRLVVRRPARPAGPDRRGPGSQRPAAR